VTTPRIDVSKLVESLRLDQASALVRIVGSDLGTVASRGAEVDASLRRLVEGSAARLARLDADAAVKAQELAGERFGRTDDSTPGDHRQISPRRFAGGLHMEQALALLIAIEDSFDERPPVRALERLHRALYERVAGTPSDRRRDVGRRCSESFAASDERT